MDLRTDSPGVVGRRGLSAGDLDDVQRLVDLCNRFEGLDLALNLERADSGTQQDTNQFLYHEDGVPIGCATLWGHSEIEATVRMLLAEDRRNIFLEVATDNQPALSLYRSFGFRETATYSFYDLEA